MTFNLVGYQPQARCPHPLFLSQFAFLLIFDLCRDDNMSWIFTQEGPDFLLGNDASFSTSHLGPLPLSSAPETSYQGTFESQSDRNYRGTNASSSTSQLGPLAVPSAQGTFHPSYSHRDRSDRKCSSFRHTCLTPRHLIPSVLRIFGYVSSASTWPWTLCVCDICYIHLFSA
jgi:hypothetical protein